MVKHGTKEHIWFCWIVTTFYALLHAGLFNDMLAYFNSKVICKNWQKQLYNDIIQCQKFKVSTLCAVFEVLIYKHVILFE